jgi:hypothetical protein
MVQHDLQREGLVLGSGWLRPLLVWCGYWIDGDGEMSKETGGPAFPVGDIVERDEKGHLHGPVIGSAGMTMRDYLAAKAMQGILSNPGQLDNVNDEAARWVARDAYLVADAMLKARNQ